MNAALLWHLGRLFSWPHWKAHAARTVLTSVGVALGVATVVAIADVSRSVLIAFQAMVDAVAGEADLEVSNPAGDVDENLIGTLEHVEDVTSVAGVIERFLPLEEDTGSSLYLLGLDFLGSNLWKEQFPRSAVDIDDEIAFLAQSDSVVVPKTFLQKRHVKVGDTLRVVTPAGGKVLVVRGVLGDTPASRLFGGDVALMDLPAAQKVLGHEHRVDRIAIDAAAGADTDGVAARVKEALAASGAPAASLEVARPEVRGKQAEHLLFSLRTTLAIMSLGAIIVGAFIVYHTIAISVMQRRREFALLNASGVSRRMLTKACVLESACLALPGVALGVGLGHLLATVASHLVGMTASEIWVQVDIQRTEASMGGWGIASVMGMATALVASYAAIRTTFMAPTVETLRPAGLTSERPGAVVIPLTVAGVCLAGVWLVMLCPSGLGFIETVSAIISTQALGYIAVGAAAAPTVLGVGTLAAAYGTAHLSLPEVLAADNLPRQPGRSGGTVATIAATIAIAATVAILVKSHDQMSLGWIEQNFGADLFVGRGQRVRLMASAPMSAGLAELLAGIPGVRSIEIFRTIPIRLGNRPTFVQGLSVEQRLAHGGLPMVHGTLVGAAKALMDGTGVLLSENLAFKLDLGVGDYVNVPTVQGPKRFRIEGLYVDYLGSLDLGAIMVEQRYLATLWDDREANLFRVWLARSADPETVRAKIRTALSPEGGQGGTFFVLGAGEFVDSIRRVIRRFFSATWALEFVAALVGVIGVVNTQLATVLDRAAELGVLRTIGLSRKDIIRSVVVECAALGTLGGILGIALGLVLGAQIVLVSLKLVTGWSMALHVPWEQLVVGVALATGVSALAGYVPARAAASVQLGQRSID